MSPQASECPYAGFKRVREEGGVSELQPGMYLVARHEDVKTILMDWRLYSAVVGTNNPFEVFGPTPVQDQIDTIMRDYPEEPVLMRTDPPRHTRVRKLVSRALTTAEVDKLQPQIRGLVEALAQPWIGKGSVEFVSAFAARLPSAVTTAFLGAPPQMEAKFKFWAGEVMSRFDGPQPPERQLEVARNIAEMGRYFLEQIAQRRRGPTGDLVSLLAHAELDGDRLDDTAIVNVIETFLIGGHETTTYLLAESFHRLAQNPEIAEHLRRKPGEIPDFVEEILRLHSPAQAVLRSPTQDVELGGVKIPAGAVVVASLASANRDESVFEAPDVLQPNRASNPLGSRHLAFGYGAHACIGLHLARAEARTALEALLPAMTDLALEPSCPIERLENVLLRGPTRLQLLFNPVHVA